MGKNQYFESKSEKFSRAFGAQKYLLPNFNFNDVGAGGASQNWCRTKASHLSQEVTARMYVPYQFFFIQRAKLQDENKTLMRFM